MEWHLTLNATVTQVWSAVSLCLRLYFAGASDEPKRSHILLQEPSESHCHAGMHVFHPFPDAEGLWWQVALQPWKGETGNAGTCVSCMRMYVSRGVFVCMYECVMMISGTPTPPSLVLRPFPPPVFDCLLYANTEGEVWKSLCASRTTSSNGASKLFLGHCCLSTWRHHMWCPHLYLHTATNQKLEEGTTWEWGYSHSSHSFAPHTFSPLTHTSHHSYTPPTSHTHLPPLTHLPWSHHRWKWMSTRTNHSRQKTPSRFLVENAHTLLSASSCPSGRPWRHPSVALTSLMSLWWVSHSHLGIELSVIVIRFTIGWCDIVLLMLNLDLWVNMWSN